MQMRSLLSATLAIWTAGVLGCARPADPPPEYPPLDATPPELVPDPAPPVAVEPPAEGTPPQATDTPAAPAPGSPPAAPESTPGPGQRPAAAPK